MNTGEVSDQEVAGLAYGVFTLPGGHRRRIGVRLGTRILDLATLADAGQVPEQLAAPSLDAFMAAGPAVWNEARRTVTHLVVDRWPVAKSAVVDTDGVTMHLPFTVADYVDFYSSLHHAVNVGRIFRPDADPLPPNWRHLPAGYHGRASSVVVSGTEIPWPSGQRPDERGGVSFGPSRRLDFELEVGFVIGTCSTFGEPVPIDQVMDHVFGVVLVNDWSARDIQAWEYQPLGPFLGKSFATTISAWVVPLDAFEAVRVPGPAQKPQPLPYLRRHHPWGLDLDLTVKLRSAQMRARGLDPVTICRVGFAEQYWTVAQQLAHLTSNGAPLRTGDLVASGTVSGPGPGQMGSLLEATRGGVEPLPLPGDETRTFLQPGDEVILEGQGGTVRLGEARGTVTSTPAARRRAGRHGPRSRRSSC